MKHPSLIGVDKGSLFCFLQRAGVSHGGHLRALLRGCLPLDRHLCCNTEVRGVSFSGRKIFVIQSDSERASLLGVQHTRACERARLANESDKVSWKDYWRDWIKGMPEEAKTRSGEHIGARHNTMREEEEKRGHDVSVEQVGVVPWNARLYHLQEVLERDELQVSGNAASPCPTWHFLQRSSVVRCISQLVPAISVLSAPCLFALSWKYRSPHL